MSRSVTKKTTSSSNLEISLVEFLKLLDVGMELEEKFGANVKLRNGKIVSWDEFFSRYGVGSGKEILAGRIPTKIVNKEYLTIKRLERIGGDEPR